MAPVSTEADLAAEVADQHWYHTIDLPDGLVTPGFFDTRTAARRVPLPESLAERRCLDLGSADGFWAFEMERRGAAEVIAVDVADPTDQDWPGVRPPANAPDTGRARRAFATAHEALGSSVQRVELSAYDVTAEELGRFDFVFVGNLLLHLRDPIGALMAVRSVLDGELLSVDVISILATLTSPFAPSAILSRRLVPYWWVPNVSAYRAYFGKAGYELIETGRPFFTPFGKGYPSRPPLAQLLRRPKFLWFWTVNRRLGASTSWIRARPLGAD